MKNFRPIRPATIESEDDLHKLRFPLYAFPKYDGIRCVILDGKVLSKTLKPIPNLFIQEALKALTQHYFFDGELILDDTKDYNKVQSAVMSREGRPFSFCYIIFDRVLNNANWIAPYSSREDWINSFYQISFLLHNRPAMWKLVNSVLDVLEFEKFCLNLGYEGIILRSPTAPYKFGRSTFKEQFLLKFKRFEDAEAEILDCVELEHNLNRPDVDELGYAKRSSHQAHKIGSGMLGSFKVRGINGRYKDKVFFVSCGSMTHEDKELYWREFNDRFGLGCKIITYKYAKHRGTDDAPAEPIFKAFKNAIDL